MSYIQTLSGKHFNYLDIQQDDIVIEDIATALSHICRFAGHLPEFYSVGQHSVLTSHLVPQEFALEALLHDAAEAYLQDIPSPLICVDDAMPITDALSELSHFIHRHAYNLKYMKVWGNGATFDNVILRGAYERAGRICPWEFWNDHDVRTIVTLGRSVGFDPKRDMPFIGDVHNALADARHQAKYVSAIWQKIIPATSTNE